MNTWYKHRLVIYTCSQGIKICLEEKEKTSARYYAPILMDISGQNETTAFFTERLVMTSLEQQTKLSDPPSNLASIFLDIASVISTIPTQTRFQARDNRTRLLASIMTMNLLWAVWMIFIERIVVGMQWTAVADLRLSALLWNTVAAVVWTGHIEHGLSALWQHHTSARYQWMYWYWTALVISLLSQVPIQVIVYIPPMLWGDAVWSEVRWSWTLALLFSPVIGIYFGMIQVKLESILDLASSRISQRREVSKVSAPESCPAPHCYRGR
jgi:hypothetical protein